jgi:hypothetical protein
VRVKYCELAGVHLSASVVNQVSSPGKELLILPSSRLPTIVRPSFTPHPGPTCVTDHNVTEQGVSQQPRLTKRCPETHERKVSRAGVHSLCFVLSLHSVALSCSFMINVISRFDAVDIYHIHFFVAFNPSKPSRNVLRKTKVLMIILINI